GRWEKRERRDNREKNIISAKPKYYAVLCKAEPITTVDLESSVGPARRGAAGCDGGSAPLPSLSLLPVVLSLLKRRSAHISQEELPMVRGYLGFSPGQSRAGKQCRGHMSSGKAEECACTARHHAGTRSQNLMLSGWEKESNKVAPPFVTSAPETF
ncbi:Interleukin-13, partial [Frankliniella fusca]